jgi:hypothetical protein
MESTYSAPQEAQALPGSMLPQEAPQEIHVSTSDDNIARLTPGDVENLIGVTIREFTESENVLGPWKTKVVKYYELYSMVQSRKNYDGLANIFVPEILRAVETVTAKIYQMITGQPDWFEYEGRDNNGDEGPAIALTQLVKYQMAENNFKARLMDSIRQMVIAGICVRKVLWDYEQIERTMPQFQNGAMTPKSAPETIKDTWTLEPVNLLEFHISDIDTPYNDLQKARWIGEESLVNKNYIKDKMRRGWFSKEHKEKLDNYGDTSKQTRSQEYIDKKLSSAGFSQISKKGKYIVKERWGLLEAHYVMSEEEIAQKNLESDDLVEAVLIICNDDCILKLEVNPFWHKQKPYVACPYVPIEGQLTGLGIAQIGESLQEEINDTRNQTMDNKTLILACMWLKSRGSGINNDQLKIRPNGVIVTNDINGLVPLRPPVVSGVGTNMESIAKDDLRQSVGASSNLQGIAQAGIGTATEASQVNRESMGRLLLSTELFCELLLKPILLMAEYLNYQFYDHIKVIKIVGPTGVKFRDLKPEEIAGYKNISIKFAVEAAENPSVMRQQMMNFANILFNLPPEAIQFHWKMLDKTYGMFFLGHSLSELYPAPVDPADLLTPEEERDIVLGEQGVVAQKGQNQKEAIMYHEKEFDQMKYALTPMQFELYTKLIKSHYEILLQEQKEEQMQMLQMQMQLAMDPSMQEGGKPAGKTDKRNPNTGPHTMTGAPSTGGIRQGLGG